MKIAKTVLSILLLLCILCTVLLVVPSATITERAGERYEELAFGEE